MSTTIDPDATKERTAVISVVLDLVFLGPSIVVAILGNSVTLYADLLGDFNVFSPMPCSYS